MALRNTMATVIVELEKEVSFLSVLDFVFKSIGLDIGLNSIGFEVQSLGLDLVMPRPK